MALQFFNLDVNASNVLSPDLWAEVWASYAVFDPSYANKQVCLNGMHMRAKCISTRASPLMEVNALFCPSSTHHASRIVPKPMPRPPLSQNLWRTIE